MAVSDDGFIYITGWTIGALNGQLSSGENHNNRYKIDSSRRCPLPLPSHRGHQHSQRRGGESLQGVGIQSEPASYHGGVFSGVTVIY